MSIEINLTSLKTLAQAATPGFWNWSKARTQQYLCANGSCFAGIAMPARDRYQKDAKFIAAARPDVVVALLERIESLTSFLGEVQGVCLGVAMSGKDHPNPDSALMGLFEKAQELGQKRLTIDT